MMSHLFLPTLALLCCTLKFSILYSCFAIAKCRSLCAPSCNAFVSQGVTIFNDSSGGSSFSVLPHQGKLVCSQPKSDAS
jgi:hypothetical protein